MIDLTILDGYPILSEIYFGNTILQYIMALLILLGTAIVAKIVYYIIKKYVKALTAKTDTNLDDLLIDALEKPFLFFLVIIGLNLSLVPLTIPADIMAVLSNIIKILFILDGAWVLTALINVAVEEFLVPYTRKSRSKLDDQLVPILANGMKIIVFTITILTIISNFGYDITAVLGGLGIAGIAIGLAAQDSISNIIGSAAIFTDRPFEIEDLVKVDGVTGRIEEIGMRSTRIRTLDGTLVTIPNSTVAKSAIENITRTPKRRVQVRLGVEYGTTSKKIDHAKDVLLDIVRNTKGVDPDECTVHFIEFGDYALQLMLTYHVLETSRYFDVQDDVNSRIKEEFEKLGIEFAFPSRTLYIKD